MNNYMMHSRLLQCRFLPPADVHPEAFRNADRAFKVVPWARMHRAQVNKARTSEQAAATTARLVAKEQKKRDKLAAMGYDYDFSGYANKPIAKAAATTAPAAAAAKAGAKSKAAAAAAAEAEAEPVKGKKVSAAAAKAAAAAAKAAAEGESESEAEVAPVAKKTKAASAAKGGKAAKAAEAAEEKEEAAPVKKAAAKKTANRQK